MAQDPLLLLLERHHLHVSHGAYYRVYSAVPLPLRPATPHVQGTCNHFALILFHKSFCKFLTIIRLIERI